MKVPKRLIADTELPASARALFVALLGHRQPNQWDVRVSRRELGRLAGLKSPTTVERHLQILERADWLDISGGSGRPLRIRLRDFHGEMTVKLPGLLASSPVLTPAAKCLYTMLSIHRDPRTGSLQAQQPKLAAVCGLGSSYALQNAVLHLQQAGWLAVQRGAGGRVYKPLDPHLALRRAVLERLIAHIRRRAFVGEALMQAMLTECIADQAYQDNARPRAITNPLTGEPLEFDRLYHNANIAVEFNGPQHYRATALFPDPEKVFDQQARDLIKDAQARRHGIKLVTIDPPELSFAKLQAKLRPLLPTRELRREDPVVRHLEKASKAYRKKLPLP